MKLFEKKDSIIIEEDDLQDARLSSIDFSDKIIKKRAFLNVLAARLAMKMLFSQKIEANNLYSLYTIHSVIEELDIADIYYQGIKIDVRLVFNREEIFIPKSHFKRDLLPDLYFVFELYEDFSGVEFLGFFEPKTLNVQNANKDFYFYEYDRLLDPKTIKTFLNDFTVEGNFNVSEDNFKNAEEMFISLIDKEISQKDKFYLFKCLASDISLREKMVEFENFEILSKEAAKNDSLIKDGVLDIVGAQQLFEDEVTSLAEDKAEIIGEVLTDLLEYNTSEESDTNSDDEFLEELNNISSDLEIENEELEKTEEIAEKTPDENLIDLDSFVTDLEDEAKLNEKSDKKNNLGGFAAGAILGGTIAGGVAAAAKGAELENDLAKLGIDVVSAGINIGTEAVSSGINSAKEAAGEIKNISKSEKEPEDEFLDELEDDLILDDDDKAIDEPQSEIFNEFEEINESESYELPDELIEEIAETENTGNFEENFVLPEVEFEDEDGPEEGLKLSLTDTFEPLSEISSNLEEYNITQEIESEDNLIDNFSEFDNFDNEIELEDNSAIEEKYFGNLEDKMQETDLVEEDFDVSNYEILDEIENDENNLYGNKVSFDEISAKQDEEILQGQSLEDFEPNSELDIMQNEIQGEDDDSSYAIDDAKDTANDANKEVYNESDDFIAQVDEFLKDVELSDEKMAFLEEAFTSENFNMDSVINSSTTSDEKTFKNEDLEKTAQTDGLQTSGKKEQISLLFQNEKLNNLLNVNIDGKKIVESLVKDKKKMIIAASVASVVLVSTVIGGSMLMHKNNNNMNALKNNVNASQPVQGQNPGDPLQNNPANPDLANQQTTPQNADPLALPQPDALGSPQGNQQVAANRDMGKAVSDAFSSEPVNATISKIAWEVPEDLAYNDGFRKYLQIAGNNLKLNLQNNLLLATELAYSNRVVVDLTMGNGGSLQSSNIKTSSGSKQIDNIVLQSVKETLMYLKMPSSELNGGSVNATLIINF